MTMAPDLRPAAPLSSSGQTERKIGSYGANSDGQRGLSGMRRLHENDLNPRQGGLHVVNDEWLIFKQPNVVVTLNQVLQRLGLEFLVGYVRGFHV